MTRQYIKGGRCAKRGPTRAEVSAAIDAQAPLSEKRPSAKNTTRSAGRKPVDNEYAGWSAILILHAARCKSVKDGEGNNANLCDRLLLGGIHHVASDLNLRDTPTITNTLARCLELGIFSELKRVLVSS